MDLNELSFPHQVALIRANRAVADRLATPVGAFRREFGAGFGPLAGSAAA